MYELRLVHAERAGDPAEEPEVGAEVEVDDAADAALVVGALAGEVELGEVDAVVDGLDAEEGEEEEEDEGAHDVDEGRHPEVLQRRHGCVYCSLEPPLQLSSGNLLLQARMGREKAGEELIAGKGMGVVMEGVLEEGVMGNGTAVKPEIGRAHV